MFVSYTSLKSTFLVLKAVPKKWTERRVFAPSETGPRGLDPAVNEDSRGGDRGIEAESALHRDLAGAFEGGKRQLEEQGERPECGDRERLGDAGEAGAFLAVAGPADRGDAEEDRRVHEWAEGCHGEEPV